jgi:hypothetical protein
MKVARTAADVLADHVVFEIESIDRMLLGVYQPRLQYGAGVTGFFRHRGFVFASSALMGPITDRFVADIRHYIAVNSLDLVSFAKGERKDEVAGRYLAAAARAAGCGVEELPEQVLFVGRAQEKTVVWRTTKRIDPATGQSYPWLVKSTAVVNHFYFYLVDADFGPMWLKYCTYFPYNAKVCLNGHEYAKRQAIAAGIEFTALDNGFATIGPRDGSGAGSGDRSGDRSGDGSGDGVAAGVAGVQSICAGLSADRIERLVFKWLRRLPYPFTEEDTCLGGYEYDISVLQAEFSLTQVLDSPGAGRVLFEQLIRDNLDLGRPDQVGLVFDRGVRVRGRHPTPGRFRTRVLTTGVHPSLHIDYKSSRIKQYHKHGRALRTETTINNARDFGIGKRLSCLPALAQVGYNANHRLLRVEQISHDPADGHTALHALTSRITTSTGQPVPGINPLDPRGAALLQALCGFALLPNGFTNRDLRTRLADLLDRPSMTSGQMTYDLRRLREHGLIERIPGSFRYLLTDTGSKHARFFTTTLRHWRTGLAQITDPSPPWTTALRRADRAYQHAIDELLNTTRR